MIKNEVITMEKLFVKQHSILNRRNIEHIYDDLSKPEIFDQHACLLTHIANSMLVQQKKYYVIDDYNKKILRFLTYYFNNCKICEDIFSKDEYKLSNQILLCGPPGTGKTLIMKIFSEYLKLTKNPKYYRCSSVTAMINYYKLNNNLDEFTFNKNSDTNKSNPFNICMNDIGLDTYKHYGVDIKILIDEFLYARNEILVDSNKSAHITTNLDVANIRKNFDERLVDRFKTYNIISLIGPSRR